MSVNQTEEKLPPATLKIFSIAQRSSVVQVCVESPPENISNEIIPIN